MASPWRKAVLKTSISITISSFGQTAPRATAARLTLQRSRAAVARGTVYVSRAAIARGAVYVSRAAVARYYYVNAIKGPRDRDGAARDCCAAAPAPEPLAYAAAPFM